VSLTQNDLLTDQERQFRRVIPAYHRRRSRVSPGASCEIPTPFSSARYCFSARGPSTPWPPTENSCNVGLIHPALLVPVHPPASVIRSLGLSKRAVQLKRLCSALSTFDTVPNEPAHLLDLPGVGPYAAPKTVAACYQLLSRMMQRARASNLIFGDALSRRVASGCGRQGDAVLV
jgi:hypothetical protein